MYKISKLIVTLVCASLITSCQSHSRATRSANVYNWDSDQVCHDQNDKAHMEGQPATLSINNGDQVKIKHMRSKHFHLDVHKYGTQPSGCASNSPDNPFDNIPFDTHWYRRDFTSGNIDQNAVNCVYSFLIKVKNDTGGQCDPHVAIEQ